MSVDFNLDTTKTEAAAFNELNYEDFIINTWKEEPIPDFEGMGISEFTSADSALLGKFTAADFEALLLTELG